MREVLAHVARTDLRVIAITDHNTIAGALEARSLAELLRRRRVIVWRGGFDQPMAIYGAAHRAGAAAGAPRGRDDRGHPRARAAWPSRRTPTIWFVPSLGRAGLRERCAGPGCEWPLDAIEASTPATGSRASTAPPPARASGWGCRWSAAATPTTWRRSAWATRCSPARAPQICATPCACARRSPAGTTGAGCTASSTSACGCAPHALAGDQPRLRRHRPQPHDSGLANRPPVIADCQHRLTSPASRVAVIAPMM